MPIFLFTFLRWRGYYKQTWHGWTRDAIQWNRIRQFVRLGAPAAAMILLEVTAFEVCVVFFVCLDFIVFIVCFILLFLFFQNINSQNVDCDGFCCMARQ